MQYTQVQRNFLERLQDVPVWPDKNVNEAHILMITERVLQARRTRNKRMRGNQKFLNTRQEKHKNLTDQQNYACSEDKTDYWPNRKGIKQKQQKKNKTFNGLGK